MTDAVAAPPISLVPPAARPPAQLPMALGSRAPPTRFRAQVSASEARLRRDLWWTQQQVQRLGAGKDPDPSYSPRRAVLHALKRDGRNILRRRRGI